MKLNRLYTLRMLVGLSLLLLLVFLVFWNYENYKKEKTELTQDLKNQMSLACSEYRDSVVKNIFRLVKTDGATWIESFSDEIQGSGKKRFKARVDHDMHKMDSLTFDLASATVLTESFVGKKERYFHGEENSHTVDTIIDIAMELPSGLGNQREIVIWKSDKDSSINLDFAHELSIDTTIIWGTTPSNSYFGDTPFLRHSQMPTLYNKIDSLFTQRLEQNAIFIDHDKSKELSNVDSIQSVIIIPYDYETLGITTPPIAIFRNYRNYIFRKLAPALILSLLLFGIVATSFFVVMRSWAAQLRLTKLKNEFISNMTHELNTPIATVGVAIEALENYGAMDDPIKRAEYLDISKHEINRLKILVDKVLKMSMMDQNYDTLSKANFDFKSLVESTIQNLKIHFENEKVELTTTIGLGDFSIVADKVHLTNVLHNLIDNAIKYSPDGPRIKLTLEEKQDSIYFKIEDQGIGIPKNYQGKIFDRFFRVPTDDRHNVKGHGLGLHYVQSIIKQHGGKIRLDSKAQKGTTLIIEIPKQHD